MPHNELKEACCCFGSLRPCDPNLIALIILRIGVYSSNGRVNLTAFEEQKMTTLDLIDFYSIKPVQKAVQSEFCVCVIVILYCQMQITIY
jgi:hypothetical protein